MVYTDFRNWLDELERSNDLLRIDHEVNPEPDIGAIGRAVCDMQGPAVLMTNVKGYKIPATIGTHAAFRRVAAALGIPSTSGHDQIMEAWNKAYERYPVRPVERSDGPCKEVIRKGDEINLFEFPLHRINRNDGSFYISKGNVITRNPQNGLVNVGIYRMMVLSRNETCLMMNFGQHGSRHFMATEENKKRLEVAVSLGNEPVLPMVAGSKIPFEWGEFEMAGATRGAPYELTKAETVDLPVPARAEIVLEGYLEPNLRAFEGTFGEFPGAYTGYLYAPVFRITAITHRRDPIFESLYIGRPNSEPNYLSMHSKLAGVFYEIKKIMPAITRIAYLKPYVHVLVIQGRWVHTADPKIAMNAAWGSSHGRGAKIIICVDEDVDPWNAEEVLWAVSTRMASPDDVVIIPKSYSSLDPAQVNGMTTKMGIDATKPRPPYFRFNPVDWVERPEKTDQWKKYILDSMRD